MFVWGAVIFEFQRAEDFCKQRQDFDRQKGRVFNSQSNDDASSDDGMRFVFKC